MVYKYIRLRSKHRHSTFKTILFCLCMLFGSSFFAADESSAIPVLIKQQLLVGQFSKAATSLKVLSNEGHVEAQYQLAILYLNGRGVNKSYDKAERLLMSSASKNVNSSYLLGSLYYKGDQLKKDNAAARTYLKIASTFNHRKAKKLLKKINDIETNISSNLPSIQMAFLNSINKGDLENVVNNYRKGADLNRKDKFGNTPLMTGITSHQPEVVDWLLQQSVLLTSKNIKGNTALHLAAMGNQLTTIISLSQNLSNLSPLNKNNQTPLMLASINSQKKTVQWLLSKVKQPNLKDAFGKMASDYAQKTEMRELFKTKNNTQSKINSDQLKHQLIALKQQQKTEESIYYKWPVIHIAVSQKQQKLTKMLLKQGNDPWVNNANGESAIELAVNTQQTGLVDEMLRAFPLTAKADNQSVARLFAAAINMNNGTLCRMLFDHTSSNGSSIEMHNLIEQAVKQNSYELVEYLLGKQPALASGQLLLFAVNNNFIEIVKSLISQDVQIDWQDDNNMTALMTASKTSNAEMSSLLLSANAAINLRDLGGQTALMKSALVDCVSCVNLLLSNNADGELSSKTGNTALMFAAQNSPRSLNLLLTPKTKLSRRNNATMTALMLAIKSNNIESTKILLEAGANPNRKNQQGQDAYDLSKDSPVLKELLNDF